MATFRPVTDIVPARASDSPFAEAWQKIEATTKFAPKLADIWTPQPGPQEKAFNCESYELLYGGAAFGGKSEWLLHDGLKQIAHPQYKALLLRRTFPELRELIDRSFVAFKKLDGTWNEQAKRWTFPSGATYQFGYCIHGDAPVLMADGHYRPMRNIRAGDVVQTLTGPRRVRRHWSVGMRESVEIRVDGTSTIASATHKLLAADGTWLTPDDFAHVPAEGDGNGYTAQSPSTPGILQPRVWYAPLMLHAPASPTQGRVEHGSAHFDASECEWTPTALQDFQGGYRPESRFGDAPARQGEGASQARTLLRGDAGTHAPTHTLRGGLANTPRCSPTEGVSYFHPYTMERQFPSEGVRLGVAEIVRVGEQALWDMTVEGSNHYITKAGIVHQNCENYSDVMQYQGQQFAWIGYDELGQCTEERIWTYLMSRNRAPYAGLKTFMRSSANPGGPGHHWLKRRFIENCPADGTPFEQENGITRSFIQAFMRDNVIGLKHDPAYATRLEMLPEVEYKWLAEGDWSAGAGMGLSDLQRHKHLVEPFNPPRHWTAFGAFDWGYNHPFFFGLFVCDEDGNVYLVDSVQGRRLQPDQIAARIIDTMESKGYDVKKLSHIHAGHDCWADRKARGELVPTIAEQFYEYGLSLSKANISRISGVQNMRRYLRWRATDGTEIEPRFRIFKTPTNLKVLECLESRVSDPDNIEDILKTDAADNGEGGDDAYDMVRYGLASRPLQAESVPVIKSFERFQDLNEFDEFTNDRGPIMQFGSWV